MVALDGILGLSHIGSAKSLEKTLGKHHPLTGQRIYEYAYYRQERLSR